MASKLICFLLMVLTVVVLDVDCCRNTMSLRKFDVIDRSTGKVVTRLPLKATKNLIVKVAVDVRETMNQDWFSARITAEATATLAPFNFRITRPVPCSLKTGCEFRQMSCVKIQKYLGFGHIGCPLRGPKTYLVSATLPKIGDLSVHIPQGIRGLVTSIEVTGKLDVWDNYGSQIGCFSIKLFFYKDY